MTLGITAGGLATAGAIAGGVGGLASGAASLMGAAGGGGGTTGASSGNKKLMNRAQILQESSLQSANIENQLGKEGAVQIERARQGIFDLLGMPGTYEENYEDYVARTGGGPGIGAPTGQFNLVEQKEPATFPTDALPHKGLGVFTKDELKAKKQWDKTGGLVGDDPGDRAGGKGEAWILDPDKYVQNVSQTRQFRMMSRATAEADQLSRQEGPLWEKVKQSVQNPIIQASAVAGREMQEVLSRESARGGSARNRAVQVANQIQSNNQVLNDRTNALWTSGLAVKQWTIDNQRMQLAFNQSWVSNLNGIRDTFSGLMQNAQQFYGAQILPMAVGAAGNMPNFQASDSTSAQLAAMQGKRDQDLGSLVSGAIESIAGGLATWKANQSGSAGSQPTMSGSPYGSAAGLA